MPSLTLTATSPKLLHIFRCPGGDNGKQSIPLLFPQRRVLLTCFNYESQSLESHRAHLQMDDLRLHVKRGGVAVLFLFIHLFLSIHLHRR